ncbi:MAG TPA: hypothetical protein VMN60_13525 [Longimicrobiales bacterium]|nr:hypothetical protein [Longimicrobiales bacterium]
MTRYRVPLLLLLLALSACAGGRGGSALYRRDIGTASGPDARMLAQQVIERHGYELEQFDEQPEIRLLTKWRPRRPLGDEAALGITAAESRILVVARQRAMTELGPLYNVTLTMENRVRVAGSTDWNETVNTPLFRQYADEITNDYKTLVTNIGVRRFECC